MRLDWCDPLEFCERYLGYTPLILLHSSLPHERFGRYSILAVGLEESVSGNWEDLKHAINSDKSEGWNARWFGYLGYEMGAPLADQPAQLPFPPSWFGRFGTVFVFDHYARSLERFGPEIAEKPTAVTHPNPVSVRRLQSNMSRAEYLRHIEDTLAQIRGGEFYQANITRKFFGEFEAPVDGFALFQRLCTVSPGSYSAYFKLEQGEILSSSPECFVTINDNAEIESRPIKGTAPRHSNPQALANSSKDRAENLMIVDLMRNDLAHSCTPGSIQVDKLFEVTSYATLHHMDSTIRGQLAEDVAPLDAIRHCFPPGSMTGAPKKAVMEWCQQVEQQQRGIYSGALGWISPQGAADLSVVIRTLCLQNQRFEFQIGGGIVADSSPEAEWEETLTKAQGIVKALEIDISRLAGL